MSTTDVKSPTETRSKLPVVDLRLEVVVIPVADADASKAFYGGLGWRLDADFSFDNGFRVVQFTPPGSGASIQFGTNITTAEPGNAQGLYLVVSDVQAARAELARCGADVTEVFHPGAPGGQFEPAGPDGRIDGMDENRSSYGSFAILHDPDGNVWLLQEVTTRFPGRVDPARPPMGRPQTSRTRCGAPRSPTANTKPASARPTRTGPTGTRPTWSPKRPAHRCLSEPTSTKE